MTTLESAFEQDLRACMLRVYELRAHWHKESVEQRVLSLLERERRWLIPLTAGVWLGVAALPVFGIGAVLGSLVLLYVGATASGMRVMRRAEQVERAGDPRSDPEAAAEQAWETRPSFGAEERAHLIRLMNLTRSISHARARLQLSCEVREARACEALASWSFLADLEELLGQEQGAVTPAMA